MDDETETPELEKAYRYESLADMADDWMDHKCDKVCANGVEENYSSFLKRNSPDNYAARVEHFKQLLLDLKVLCKNPTTNLDRKYYFSSNFDVYKQLFKYVGREQ